MFKQVFTLALAFLASTAFAQKPLKPSNNSTEKLLIWKPTKKEYSIWNTSTNTFDLSDSTYFTYINSQNDPIYQLRKVSGLPTNAWINGFDNNGNRILEASLVYNSGTSSLDTVNKSISSFDNFNNQLDYKYFNNYISGIGTLSTHKIFTHQLNSQNKPLETIVQRYNFTNSTFENDDKYTYVYNSNGKTSLFIAEYWNGLEWEKSEKYELTFDGNGFYNGYIYYENDGSNNWVINSRITNGVPFNPYEDFFGLEFKSSLTERYDVATATYFLDQRRTFTESTGNNIDLYEVYVAGNWQLDSKTEDSFDVFGNNTRRLQTYLNSSNQLDTSIYYVNEYTNDVSNHPSVQIKTDSLNNFKYKYVYSDYVQINIQVAQLEEEVVKNEFQLYPNPTNHSFSIDGIDFSTVTIYNSTGNLVYTSDQKSINISTLPAGMYYVRILNDDKVLGVQKLIKE